MSSARMLTAPSVASFCSLSVISFLSVSSSFLRFRGTPLYVLRSSSIPAISVLNRVSSSVWVLRMSSSARAFSSMPRMVVSCWLVSCVAVFRCSNNCLYSEKNVCCSCSFW